MYQRLHVGACLFVKSLARKIMDEHVAYAAVEYAAGHTALSKHQKWYAYRVQNAGLQLILGRRPVRLLADFFIVASGSQDGACGRRLAEAENESARTATRQLVDFAQR